MSILLRSGYLARLSERLMSHRNFISSFVIGLVLDEKHIMLSWLHALETNRSVRNGFVLSVVAATLIQARNMASCITQSGVYGGIQHDPLCKPNVSPQPCLTHQLSSGLGLGPALFLSTFTLHKHGDRQL